MLIPCAQCERPISPAAEVCPGCGHPQPVGDGLWCDKCSTPNSDYLPTCRGCGGSLVGAKATRSAYQSRFEAEGKRGKYGFWGAWLGLFPSILIGLYVGAGTCGGLLILAASAGVGAFVGLVLARTLYPFRQEGGSPPE